MPLIIYPAQPLAGIDATPATNRSFVTELTARRSRQMEALWQRVATTLGLDASDELERGLAQILPAGGAIIIERDKASEERLWPRLRAQSWIQVFPLLPLPPPLPPMAALQASGGNWHLGKINPPTGLDGTGVVVGVVDTGIDPMMFPELAGIGNVQWEYSLATKTLKAVAAPVELDTTGQHGSAVCAMLAGATSGIAKGVELVLATVPNQAVTLHGGTIAKAVDWLLKQTSSGPRLNQTVAGGCDIINISRVTTKPGKYDPALYLLLQSAGAYGTLLVAAVGNSGGVDKWQCPAAYDYVLAVGAVTEQDVVHGSAWGTPNIPPPFAPGIARPDLVAPGQGLNQPTATAPITRGGTSFASPLVAGAAALALQKDASLIGNPTAIKNRLTSLARGGPQPKWGAGILDLTNL